MADDEPRIARRMVSPSKFVKRELCNRMYEPLSFNTHKLPASARDGLRQVTHTKTSMQPLLVMFRDRKTSAKNVPQLGMFATIYLTKIDGFRSSADTKP